MIRALILVLCVALQAKADTLVLQESYVQINGRLYKQQKWVAQCQCGCGKTNCNCGKAKAQVQWAQPQPQPVFQYRSFFGTCANGQCSR